MQMESLCGVTTKFAGGLGTADIAAVERIGNWRGSFGLGFLNVREGPLLCGAISQEF